MVGPDGRKVHLCASCGEWTRKNYRAAACRSCQLAAARRRTVARLACVDCGKRRSEAAMRCRPCNDRWRAAGDDPHVVCPTCGGRKYRRSATCARCRYAAADGRPAGRAVMVGFDAAAFRRLLQRSDLELTPEILELWTGRQVSGKAIRGWLRGKHIPSVPAWELVVEALTLAHCRGCRGLGVVPTCSTADVTDAVTHPAVPVPLRIVRAAPKPLETPVSLACGLTYDPLLRRIAGRGLVARLTQSENDILAGYVHLADRLVEKEVVAELIGTTASAVNVHTSRLYVKLRAAGIDPSDLWDGVGRNTRGMRLLLAPPPATLEVAG